VPHLAECLTCGTGSWVHLILNPRQNEWDRLVSVVTARLIAVSLPFSVTLCPDKFESQGIYSMPRLCYQTGGRRYCSPLRGVWPYHSRHGEELV
jgi:hypothetical protein